MQWSRNVAVCVTLLLVWLTGADDAQEQDGLFSEFEEPVDDEVEPDDARLERHELPEDGFVWPTTDEEHFAEELSNEHHCNGCKGVAYQIDSAIKELMPKGGKRPLLEHEYTEAMECRTKIYDNYGLKKLPDSSRVLVGPGLPHTDTKKDGGSVFGGAKWPSRMARFCGALVGDLGEEEVYRLWADHGSEGFSDALCSPTCEGVKREKRKEPEEEEEKPAKKQKKARRRKNAKKEEADLAGAPQVVSINDRKQLKKLSKKRQFVFLLFCAPSFARCQDLEREFELAARAAQKTEDLKEATFALADTDTVGTLDFELAQDILPAFLLFRKGYAAPKGISPEEMLRLREAGDFLNYLQLETSMFMQDDPDNFPRGKLEL